MQSKTFGATLNGIDAEIVEVEISISSGLPNLIIVGLADTSIRESRERVRACLKNLGFEFPIGRIAVNLAPANLFKCGTQFDLSIAIGLICASGQLKFDSSDKLFLGELALEGLLRRVNGVLAMVIAAKEFGLRTVIVPEQNFAEASLVKGIEVIAVKDFKEIVAHLSGQKRIEPKNIASTKIKIPELSDFSDIAGQGFAKRGLEIAAAGGHNILLKGPPGSGKTLLAQALSSILPPLSENENLELIKIYSAAGFDTAELAGRPFRNPGQSITYAAFVGGGKSPKPGELSLAHQGVLFLDEFSEFPRLIIESLREPLENGFIKIFRVQKSYEFPAKFIFIAATNPCPCGFFGDLQKRCVCAPGKVFAYQQKLSGPILDRIDLQILVQRIDLLQYKNTKEQSSAEILQRVTAAQVLQKNRAGKLNCLLSRREIQSHCRIDAISENLISLAQAKYHFSGRTLHRVLRIARTVADLAGSEHIKQEHIAESLQYRLPE